MFVWLFLFMVGWLVDLNSYRVKKVGRHSPLLQIYRAYAYCEPVLWVF